MPSELNVHAVYQGEMKVTAAAGDFSLTMDYPLPPATTCSALRPLEVLLASLAGCSASALAILLAKMKQPLEGIEVSVHGLRQDEHPTVITDIDLEFVLRGAGVQAAAVERALKVAEEQLCPVWCMLKPGTRIKSSFVIADA